ncbi:dynamin family protein [Neobacillus sp. D3-1R]|uniref:dynamin family protein n=1 Tax=Neobacillus sp. D3-1R TaxID=3445778 RepID=UPI003FA0B8EB
MIQLIQQLEKSDFKSKVSNFYNIVKESQNQNVEKKVKQLAEKAANKEYSVAFCGHFSAGKSTMINRLIGENILPSSPIPTSANLVKVKTGEEYAKVYFKHGKPRMYLAPYDYEQVKSYCKDGDEIEWVEISHSDSKLPSGMVILDTPGIDSTDDAHRIATESAIHLADVIFYVMDYNHVQSEVNFMFTKDLTLAGKELYLVINQIDKHRNEELSFETFKQSVIDSFGSWGVVPKGVFYTSLKNLSHPLNQFDELQALIHDRINHIDECLSESVLISLKQLTQEHVLWVEEQKAEQNFELIELLNTLTEDEQNQIEESEKRLTREKELLNNKLVQFKHSFYEETEKILKNAYLMPFQTRELAQAFLESHQDGFKVGLLFSKQKTETERENRLNRFYDDIVEKVASQMDWHLRSYFQQILKENSIQDPTLLEKCQNYQTPVTKEFLISIIKPGATLSGEYLLNYTNEVVAGISRIARKQMNEIGDYIYHECETTNAVQMKKIQDEWNQIEPYIHAKRKVEEIQSTLWNVKNQMEEIINGTYKNQQVNEVLFLPIEEEMEIVRDSMIEASTLNLEEDETLDHKLPLIETEIKDEHELNKDTVVQRLKTAATELSNLNGFQQTISELKEKAARIENQGFTVALFGAFSAGKSSFANALMGSDVLPVSPNPTTAAINKILPVTEQYPHGTARVKLKNIDQLFTEINRSLKVFDLQSTDFQDAFLKIKNVISQQTDFVGNEKVHLSFLTAFSQGYVNVQNKLGEIVQTDLNEFREFVAVETKSCFVEWIELYYDCELTKQGITLVDTPGADSINARHTGVAFDYIKNSDAILFVTYYNHAFSKADREFLIQLGRVKDTFELDKMFFIINAIDLANDEEELNSVITYVKDQLVGYGIRQPNLFALSSLLGLKEKQQLETPQISHLNQFENAFYQFISGDLLQTSLSSAVMEVERIVKEIEGLIEASNQDESLKMQKKKELQEEREIVLEMLTKQSVGYLEKRVSQELNELVFYIKQRVFLRFSDFFKESFNPAVLQDDGRNLKKALRAALEEFLSSIGYDFAQELRATSLRMDSFIRKQLEEFHTRLSDQLTGVNKQMHITALKFNQNRQLEFANAFDHLNRDMFQKALSTFKNPKAFFEKNEKKMMSEELHEVLQAPSDEYLQNGGQRLNEFYIDLLCQLFEQKMTHTKQEVEEFYSRYISLLDQKGQTDELLKVLSKLK